MKPVKLFCGYEWSLTRFPGTTEALEAESIFNARVKAQGLTATWSVGQAEVCGDPIERTRREVLEKWREGAIVEARERRE
tara:strand:- start:130 stop:369 length:240 start_codon:yes stop_codon:yes gene_type:complete